MGNSIHFCVMNWSSTYHGPGLGISPLGKEELRHWHVVRLDSPMQRCCSILHASIPIGSSTFGMQEQLPTWQR